MSSDTHHIIFGTGPVGMAVMSELLNRNKKVIMVNRSGRSDLPDGVKIIAADCSDPAVTVKLCQNASVVYNCVNVAYHRWADLLPHLHESILEGAASAGARLVVMENLYMYGPTHGKLMTENLPYLATTRKGKVRITLTEKLFQAHREGKVQATSGRASDFFGPRALHSTVGAQVFQPALQGKPAKVLGNPDLPHTYSYIPDIGKALVILGEHEKAPGKPWHLASPKTVSTREFIDLIFQKTGHRTRMQIAPPILVKLLGLFNPLMRELDEMMYEFREPFRMDSSVFEETFNMKATALETAIDETVEWYKSNQ